jgi:CRP-like cAMP-binding protein
MDAQALKEIPLFGALNDDELELVALFAAEVSVSEGKHLVDEGDYAYEIFVIQQGEAEVKRAGETLAVLGPGNFFGEMGLLDNQQRNASVVAKTPMRLITLSHWDVNRLTKRMPGITDALRLAAKQRYEATPPGQPPAA